MNFNWMDMPQEGFGFSGYHHSIKVQVSATATFPNKKKLVANADYI